MSLNDVPDISFMETDVDTIVSKLKSVVEVAAGRSLYPGDPLIVLIQALAVILSQQASQLDYIAKQNLVKYADNGFIENLGALVGVTRLQPSSALCTLKFTISEEQTSVITIPKGTRATTGNKVYFATTEDVEIVIGEVDVSVVAECQEPGTIGNDFELGQINQIVDPFAYFEKVENITVPSGGSDLESLNNFRERIFDAPKSYSVAGPEAAYKFWAQTSNSLISDVSVYSPTPGVVELIPLLINGGLPSDEIMQEVYEYCNADERRPLTDFVEVKAPTTKEYNIDFTYYVSRKNASNLSNIESSIAAAVDEYILWQKGTLGRDINHSKLQAMLMSTGAKRLDVRLPTFEFLEYNEVAICKNINIVYGGVEDE